MYIPANLDTTQFQDDNLLKKTRFWLPIALAIFLVLLRMENNTAFTPIVDRWAILLDFMAENKNADDGFLFTIVQHGLEHESTYSEMQKSNQ